MPEVPVMPAMPADVKPPRFKSGDIVRISRSDEHGVKFGALMLVQRSGLLPFENYIEEVDVVPLHDLYDFMSPGPIMPGGWNQKGQSIFAPHVKLAKQAMLDREAARLIRIGNIPKPSNKSPLANRMRKQLAYASRRG